jgi:hypothetical protein
MGPKPETVAVVVDACFGEALEALSRLHHVWVVDSSQNRSVVRRIWAERAPSADVSLTIFDAVPGEPPETAVLRMLDMIELHHPHCTRYEILGAALGAELTEELEGLGYSDFGNIPNGFSASKRAP